MEYQSLRTFSVVSELTMELLISFTVGVSCLNKLITHIDKDGLWSADSNSDVCQREGTLSCELTTLTNLTLFMMS